MNEIIPEQKQQDMGTNAARFLVPTIFHEPWWLDIVSNGIWREVTVSSGGLMIGRLPYTCATRPPGLTVLCMPPSTYVLGPALSPAFDGTKSIRIPRQITVTKALISQLPAASHIFFRLHGGVTNTLAFEAAGFSCCVNYTVVVPPNSPYDLWREMPDKTRNVIRRAQEHLTVTELPDADRFLDFYEENLRERGRKNEFSRGVCARIIFECFRRKCGRVIATCDASGSLQSAVFTIWDQRTEYYFMSTRRLKSKNGAKSLAIWTAIQHAAQHGLTFDMDGLHLKNKMMPNLLLLTGFGGKIQPRFIVRRSSSLVQMGQLLSSTFRNLRGGADLR
jgi:hypothetical protein